MNNDPAVEPLVECLALAKDGNHVVTRSLEVERKNQLETRTNEPGCTSTVKNFVAQRYPIERSRFIDFLTRRRSSFERLSHATTRSPLQEPKEKSRL